MPLGPATRLGCTFAAARTPSASRHGATQPWLNVRGNNPTKAFASQTSRPSRQDRNWGVVGRSSDSRARLNSAFSSGDDRGCTFVSHDNGRKDGANLLGTAQQQLADSTLMAAKTGKLFVGPRHARLQRRGRPGFSPEFPVRRSPKHGRPTTNTPRKRPQSSKRWAGCQSGVFGG